MATTKNQQEIAKDEHNEAENAKNVYVVNASGDTSTKLQKLEYVTGELTYIGKNTDVAAADSDTDWTIQKLTYTSGEITLIQTKTGAWDDRATLF
jgi:hypothetical protein